MTLVEAALSDITTNYVPNHKNFTRASNSSFLYLSRFASLSSSRFWSSARHFDSSSIRRFCSSIKPDSELLICSSIVGLPLLPPLMPDRYCSLLLLSIFFPLVVFFFFSVTGLFPVDFSLLSSSELSACLRGGVFSSSVSCCSNL